MKDYINKLARGVYEYDTPVMYTSGTHIEANIENGTTYRGNFTLTSMDDRAVKGIVYSDNPSVVIDNSVFYGTENVIEYFVNTKGREPGNKIEGRIDIVSNGGEQYIYYSFTVTGDNMESSMGRIHNMFHFTNLVSTNYDEAVKMFQSDKFQEIFLSNDDRLAGIYSIISKNKDIPRTIEEFLICTHKKNPIVYGISAPAKEYENLTEEFRDSISIVRNTWGYSHLEVNCDKDFVEYNDKIIDSDRFVANKYEFRYIINPEKCHNGKNYARITFKDNNAQFELLICVKIDRERSASNIESKKLLFELEQNYVDFRTKKINMQQWQQNSIAAVEKIRAINDDVLIYKLFHAQFLIAGRKKEEAGWLINYVKERVSETDKDYNIIYAYCKYLECLIKQDKTYARKIMVQLIKIYGECEEWQILWFLMYLDEEYERNKTIKLAALKEQYYKGCNSPVMYIEALSTFNEQPQLLRVFDEFELQVIRFGIKKDGISDRLVGHISELASVKKTSSKYFLKMLRLVYDIKKDVPILENLCRILINNNNYEISNHEYYAKAVEQGVKLPGIYEAYMLSCDTKEIVELPKLLLMYFMYNNTLPEKYKSYLYACVVCNREKDGMMYENYIKKIKEYVLEQIINEKISDCDAILYNKLLELTMINASTANKIFHLLMMHRIEVKDKNIARIHIKHKEFENAQIIELDNGVAFVPLYTADYVIVFEDYNGKYYIENVEYNIKVLFDETMYISRLRLSISEDLMFWLYLNENSGKYLNNRIDYISNIKKIIAEDRISEKMRSTLIKEIIWYYHNEYEGYDLNNSEIKVPVEKLNANLRNMLLEIYINNGMYSEAVEIIKEYGVSGCNPKKILYVIRYLMDIEGDEYNVDLLKLCIYAFNNHKYDADTLKYLVRYYDGGTKSMLELWKAAENFDIEVGPLSERLMILMMFVHSYSGSFKNIFANYYNNGARERVVEAYIGYSSYNYFVKDTVIGDEVFEVIENRLKGDKNVVEVAKLALLQHYSQITLSQEQKGLAKQLIEEMCGKGMIFAFFSKFKGIIKMPFNVRCMTIVEYNAKPLTHVVIHYINNGCDGNHEYTVEDMKMIYDGMYVKQFLLFYGESIQYYITEEGENGVKHTQSMEITCEDINIENPDGRYELINDMLATKDMMDEVTLNEMIKEYHIQDYMVKELFKPL